ncbi:flavin reductase family protein [Achromobacter sp. LC458]|uniref:Flavin reductase family protein n=1 Tax=Achromobacter spanius TaxID=217203 RepID=A0A2S5GXW9_9BURK|nr:MULTISPECIES: flavin reductase family protein [Achromobacter]AYD66725.1 flavin reductase family protein [Achromobacter sp. B7]MDX3988414.1 flavin reductase family protein [Achromobacter sp.]PPA77932.1 flavin reductase family protein [Achromobacter spanius]TRM49585.1 flavin reductase family protein [Achromobacter sp. LC458]
MNFDFSQLASADAFKLLSSVVVPRPIAWVVTQSARGDLNAAPFSFFNVVSSDPPIVALGIGPRAGQWKDSSRNIMDTGEFVINVVSRELARQMNQTSLDYDASVDELARVGLSTQPSTLVAPPRIAQSPAALECKVWQVIEAAPHRVIVLARVVGMYLRDDALLNRDRFHVDTPALGLLGRMHGAGWYAHTSDLFQMLAPTAANDPSVLPAQGH